MNFRLLLWIGILMGNAFVSFSQKSSEKQTNVRGFLFDSDNKLPIEGAEIILKGSQNQQSTISDESGNFLFEKIAPGRYDLQFFHLGYSPSGLHQVEVNSGKELLISHELSPRVFSIKEIEIQQNRKDDRPVNEISLAGTRTFDVAETQRYAASFNDPARMAVSFAGVSTTSDASNEIIIRGNSSRGMLWRIEGIEIMNPNHFSNGEGGTGGGISILSSQVIGQSDFLTAAFAPEYGNAVSGVFDIKFRKGNRNKREFAFQFGILGMQASLEGPFSKKYNGSYLINYRYSTLTLLNAIGLPIVDNALVPQFQDINLHISLPTKKWGDFSLFGLGGISSAGELAIKDSSKWKLPRDRYQDNNYQILGTIGLTHSYFFKNKKTYLKTVLAASYDRLKYGLDSLNNQYDLQTVFQENLSYTTARIHSFINHQFNNKNLLKTGIILSKLFYNLKSAGNEPNEQNQQLDNSGTTEQIQIYTQWKHRFGDKMEFAGGLHYHLFLLNYTQSIEPRASFRWQTHPTQSFSLGAGLHSKPEPISVYFSGANSMSNRNLKSLKSLHIVSGYNWNFKENFKLKTEIYFQELFDVPVDQNKNSLYSIINAGAGITQVNFVNEGKGRNYGLEITLEKFFSNNYFFLFTGSLLNSQYSMGNQEKWYNTRYNGNYMLNALGGYEVKFGKNRNNYINFNLRFIWRGGNRYSPINLEASMAENKEIINSDLINSSKLRDYLRLDISTFIRFNFKRWSFITSIEIQNVTNYKNIARYSYDVFIKEIKTTYMFGIMPVFNFKFEF